MTALSTIPIGVLADESGTAIETILSYQRLGLVAKPRRVARGLLLYAPDQVERIRFIRRAMELGFSAPAIRDMLGIGLRKAVRCCDVHAIATRHLEDVRRRQADLSKLEAALSALVEDCPQDGSTTHCSIIETLAHPIRRRT